MYSRTALFTILALVMLATLLAGCSSPTATPAPVVNATPTAAPTAAPTAVLNATPTAAPTAAPTAVPNATPTGTAAPNVTAQPAPSSASVKIQNFAFDPQVVKVAAGGNVTWTNLDGTTHTVTFSDSTQTLRDGASYTWKFNTPGTYAYHCNIHTSMTGTVEVI